MLKWEHSAILSTFIKLPFVIKVFVLSLFEWPLKIGFTVYKIKWWGWKLNLPFLIIQQAKKVAIFTCRISDECTLGSSACSSPKPSAIRRFPVRSTADLRQPATYNTVYKNLPCVWGWDRKIRLEDHSLASRGLPSDVKWWSWGTDFSIQPTRIMDSFSCSPLTVYFKISCQKFLNTLQCIITWWRHFDWALTSLDDHVHEFQYNQCTVLSWQSGQDNMGKIRISDPG